MCLSIMSAGTTNHALLLLKLFESISFPLLNCTDKSTMVTGLFCLILPLARFKPEGEVRSEVIGQA